MDPAKFGNGDAASMMMMVNSALVFPDPNIIGHLEQTGPLVLGPGARRDNQGSGSGVPLAKLSSDQLATVQKAKKYAMEQSIKMVLMKQTLAHQQLQAKSMQRHQAVVLMCRVYVGSINFEVKEDTIKQAFLPFGPIRSISMSWDPITQKHKGFAFVEYEVPEAAQLALEQMNGVIMSGRNIKVGRPSNMPQAQQVIDDITVESKSFDRIYIASIHLDLTQDDIRSVFEAFGEIKTCELAMTSVPGRHKGYCFIEYATSQAATDAITSMNLFDLGGQYLRVGRSITPPDTKNNGPPSTVPQVMPTAAAVAAAAATAKIQAMDAVATNLGFKAASDICPAPAAAPAAPMAQAAPVAQMNQQLKADIPPPGLLSLPAETARAAAPPLPPADKPADDQAKQQEELQKKLMEGQEPATLQQQENMSIKGQSARHLVMQKLMRNQSESAVIVLRNMVGPDDVDDELEEEISEECSKYGRVERVIIYQERQSEEPDAEVLVKIFVEFDLPAAAKAAKSSLHGRFFGGRVVCCDVYDQDLFEHHDLSG